MGNPSNSSPPNPPPPNGKGRVSSFGTKSLMIVFTLGITMGSFLHHKEGQVLMQAMGNTDSLRQLMVDEHESSDDNNHTTGIVSSEQQQQQANQNLELLKSELEELKALKTASEQDFAALRKELSDLVAQKTTETTAEKPPVAAGATAATLASLTQQVNFTFGESNSATSRKYAPAPLIQSPFKLEMGQAEFRKQQGYTSPACTLQVEDDRVFNRIVFLHMRKAGGSSIRKYLRNVAGMHNIPLKIMEGYKEVEKPGDDPNTLYVTHMREPVSRSISHYKYEVRWDCKSQHWKPGFEPTLENQQMNLTQFALKEWRAGRRKYWICSSECYTRWATGLFHNPHTDPQIESEGRKTLFDYHMVIVSEWLKDPDYARSLESIFGETYIGRKVGMTCGDEAKAANLKVPLNITDETMDLIASRNRVDSGIYKDMTTCPYGPQFWGRHIKFEPSAEYLKEQEEKKKREEEQKRS